jgi:hypothetical protein
MRGNTVSEPERLDAVEFIELYPSLDQVTLTDYV